MGGIIGGRGDLAGGVDACTVPEGKARQNG
jgi:hypothetical protein